MASWAEREPLTRRGLLGMAGAGLTAMALAGCDGITGRSAAATPTSATTTVSELFATTPFYVAHRGGSSDWPEMTMDAYRHSVAYGMRALEVSVQRSSDGVFVCCHDPSTKRVTGVDHTIADTPWSVLSRLQVKGRAGSSAPLCRLEQVLDAYAATHVIFLEDKTYKNTDALLQLMQQHPHATDQFVWKVYGPSADAAITPAHAAGFTTWGYYFTVQMDHFAETAGRYDWVGIDYNCTQEQLAAAKAFGKPMIGHIVSTVAQRDKLLGAGCRGIILAEVARLAPTPASPTS